MNMKAMNFILKGDPSFRRDIDGCLVGFSRLLEQYRIHVLDTPKEEIIDPADFLHDNDFLVEMMIKDFDCYDEALLRMKEYAELDLV